MAVTCREYFINFIKIIASEVSDFEVDGLTFEVGGKKKGNSFVDVRIYILITKQSLSATRKVALFVNLTGLS